MKIAVAIDFSLESGAALRWALDLRDHLRRRDKPARVIAISIAPRTWFSMDRAQKTTHDPGLHHHLIFQVRHFLESIDPDVDELEIRIDEGRTAPLIIETSERENVDLLVIGRTDPAPLVRWHWGSTAHRIADKFHLPLVIVDPDHCRFPAHGKFAIGVDFSPASEKALWQAANLAELTSSQLHVIHALQDLPLTTMSTGMVNYLSPGNLANISASARESLEFIMAGIQRYHPSLTYATMVHSGTPAHILASHANQTNLDLLVLGKIRRSRTSDYLLGGVTRALVKEMPTTLLLIPT